VSDSFSQSVSQLISKLDFYHDAKTPVGQGFLIFEDSRSHSVRQSTLGRIPLYEWSARRTDLYLITHNTHNRLTSKPPAGYEPTIPASERPQTHALDRAATDRQLVS